MCGYAGDSSYIGADRKSVSLNCRSMLNASLVNRRYKRRTMCLILTGVMAMARLIERSFESDAGPCVVTVEQACGICEIVAEFVAEEVRNAEAMSGNAAGITVMGDATDAQTADTGWICHECNGEVVNLHGRYRDEGTNTTTIKCRECSAAEVNPNPSRTIRWRFWNTNRLTSMHARCCKYAGVENTLY